MKLLKLSILGVLLAMRAFAADQDVKYTADEQIDCLPVAVSLGRHQQSVFLSYAWGLAIESIICDGNPLGIKRDGIVVNEQARYVSKVENTYVYTCPASGFFFTSRTQTGDVADDVVAYDIPDRWSELIITFRARFVDGALSDRHVARFVRLSPSEMAQAAVEFAKSQEK